MKTLSSDIKYSHYRYMSVLLNIEVYRHTVRFVDLL